MRCRSVIRIRSSAEELAQGRGKGPVHSDLEEGGRGLWGRMKDVALPLCLELKDSLGPDREIILTGSE